MPQTLIAALRLWPPGITQGYTRLDRSITCCYTVAVEVCLVFRRSLCVQCGFASKHRLNLVDAFTAGTLARLFDVERTEGEASGHSITAAMAAAETCPIGALEHTAVRAGPAQNWLVLSVMRWC